MTTDHRRQTAALLTYAHDLPPGPRNAILQRVVSLNCPIAEAVFDPGQADDLLTYAIPTIRGEVQRLFRDQSWGLRPPRRLQELSAQAHASTDTLRARLGREPTSEEVADSLDCSRAQLDEARQASAALRTDSLDRPMGDGAQGAPRSEHLGRPDPLDLLDDALSVGPLLRDLPARDRHILQLRFGDDLTQAEIGEYLGVTQTQGSRLLRRILGEVRAQLGADGELPLAPPLAERLVALA